MAAQSRVWRKYNAHKGLASSGFFRSRFFLTLTSTTMINGQGPKPKNVVGEVKSVPTPNVFRRPIAVLDEQTAQRINDVRRGINDLWLATPAPRLWGQSRLRSAEAPQFRSG